MMTDSLEKVVCNLPFNTVIDIDDRSEVVFLARMLENGCRRMNH